MTLAENTFVIAAAVITTSCAVAQRDELFRQPRVTEQEIQEITPVIHKRTYHTSETIGSFYRHPDGAIEVYTDQGTSYIVRKVKSQWKIVDTGGVEY